VCKFSEDDAVTQAFLELHCRWDLLTNTRLNPAINIHTTTQMSGYICTEAQKTTMKSTQDWSELCGAGTVIQWETNCIKYAMNMF